MLEVVHALIENEMEGETKKDCINDVLVLLDALLPSIVTEEDTEKEKKPVLPG